MNSDTFRFFRKLATKIAIFVLMEVELTKKCVFFILASGFSKKHLLLQNKKVLFLLLHPQIFVSYEKTILSLVAFGPCGLHAGA